MGWGRLLGGEHASTPEWGGSSPVKTDCINVVVVVDVDVDVVLLCV